MQPVLTQWPGGEHMFALPIGQLRAVQAACNAGPMQVFDALRLGSWRIEMLESVLRCGLIGGGTDPVKAKEMVANLMDARPLLEFVPVAALVLQAALTGVEDDPVGEPSGAMSHPES